MLERSSGEHARVALRLHAATGNGTYGLNSAHTPSIYRAVLILTGLASNRQRSWGRMYILSSYQFLIVAILKGRTLLNLSAPKLLLPF